MPHDHSELEVRNMTIDNDSVGSSDIDPDDPYPVLAGVDEEIPPIFEGVDEDIPLFLLDWMEMLLLFWQDWRKMVSCR